MERIKGNKQRMKKIANQLIPIMENRRSAMNISMYFQNPGREFICVTVKEGGFDGKGKYNSYDFYSWQSDKDHQEILSQLKSLK